MYAVFRPVFGFGSALSLSLTWVETSFGGDPDLLLKGSVQRDVTGVDIGLKNQY
jgi:hypothetical protein